MVCNDEYRCNREGIYSMCSGIPHLKKTRLINLSRLLTNNPKMSGNYKKQLFTILQGKNTWFSIGIR